MSLYTLWASCPASEFARIEAVLREWPGVEAVGSIRTKDRNRNTTDVFIKFNSEDALKNSLSLVSSVQGLSLKEDKPDKKQSDYKNSTKKKGAKNLAMELLNFGTFDKSKNVLGHSGKKKFESNQRFRGNRWGRTQNGNRQPIANRGPRQEPFFIPPAKVSVALADNIPFNMTNDQLVREFLPFGRVIDINRYELMAMIFYDSPEAVSKCIQNLNGKTLKGNIISVSSGSVRIPGPVALQMGL